MLTKPHKAKLISLIILTVVYSSLNVGCMNSDMQCENPILVSEALNAAEEYVQINGYTSVEVDPKEIETEPIEAHIDKATVLKRRRGTLEKWPVGYLRTDQGWRIYFRYTNPMTYESREFYRVISVEECTSIGHIEHESSELPLGLIEINKGSEQR